jgi:hypothetical protein
MKEERAHFTSQFTNEFIFTRPTMVRGLRYAKENNSFCARLVYCEIDKKNPAKLVDSRKEFNYMLSQKKKSRLKKNGCEMNTRRKLFSTSSI